jgi:excisionase family DNA binding protein
MKMPDDLMSVDELAKRLGINRKTAYKQVEDKAIPGVRRIGKLIRIHKPTVEAWIASGVKKTA